MILFKLKRGKNGRVFNGFARKKRVQNDNSAKNRILGLV
jgi:hypothetical protein